MQHPLFMLTQLYIHTNNNLPSCTVSTSISNTKYNITACCNQLFLLCKKPVMNCWLLPPELVARLMIASISSSLLLSLSFHALRILLNLSPRLWIVLPPLNSWSGRLNSVWRSNARALSFADSSTRLKSSLLSRLVGSPPSSISFQSPFSIPIATTVIPLRYLASSLATDLD